MVQAKRNFACTGISIYVEKLRQLIMFLGSNRRIFDEDYSVKIFAP